LVGNVDSYKRYLQEELHLKCEDNGTFSHWGAHAHEAHWQVDSKDLAELKAKAIKPKKITINHWLKKNRPEVYKEYQRAVDTTRT